MDVIPVCHTSWIVTENVLEMSLKSFQEPSVNPGNGIHQLPGVRGVRSGAWRTLTAKLSKSIYILEM